MFQALLFLTVSAQFWLPISDLQYSHDEICDTFGTSDHVSFARNPHKGVNILSTLEEFLYNPHQVLQMEAIPVVFHDDKYFVVTGNRRLWVFKTLVEYFGWDPNFEVPCKKGNKEKLFGENGHRPKLTTRNGGQSIHVKKNAQFDEQFNKIYEEWVVWQYHLSYQTFPSEISLMSVENIIATQTLQNHIQSNESQAICEFSELHLNNAPLRVETSSLSSARLVPVKNPNLSSTHPKRVEPLSLLHTQPVPTKTESSSTPEDVEYKYIGYSYCRESDKNADGMRPYIYWSGYVDNLGECAAQCKLLGSQICISYDFNTSGECKIYEKVASTVKGSQPGRAVCYSQVLEFAAARKHKKLMQKQQQQQMSSEMAVASAPAIETHTEDEADALSGSLEVTLARAGVGGGALALLAEDFDLESVELATREDFEEVGINPNDCDRLMDWAATRKEEKTQQ